MLIGALAALGLVWDDSGDERAGRSGSGGGAAASAEERQADADRAADRRRTTARRRRAARRRREAAAARRTVGVRIVPESAVYVCLVSRTGRALIDGQTLTSRTQRFVGRRFRVTFGNGNVRMQLGDRAYPVPESDVPVGYDIRPTGRPRRLAAAQQPECT